MVVTALVSMAGSRVRLGIVAPKDREVFRGEVIENRSARRIAKGKMARKKVTKVAVNHRLRSGSG